jgi:uncharacterized protein (TIGR02996 family)
MTDPADLNVRAWAAPCGPHDDRRALLAACCRDLSDPLPALVYADWLDEFGDAADARQAEFLRASHESDEAAADWLIDNFAAFVPEYDGPGVRWVSPDVRRRADGSLVALPPGAVPEYVFRHGWLRQVDVANPEAAVPLLAAQGRNCPAWAITHGFDGPGVSALGFRQTGGSSRTRPGFPSAYESTFVAHGDFSLRVLNAAAMQLLRTEGASLVADVRRPTSFRRGDLSEVGPLEVECRLTADQPATPLFRAALAAGYLSLVLAEAGVTEEAPCLRDECPSGTEP